MISQAHYLNNNHSKTGVNYIFPLENFDGLIEFLWQKIIPMRKFCHPLNE